MGRGPPMGMMGHIRLTRFSRLCARRRHRRRARRRGARAQRCARLCSTHTAELEDRAGAVDATAVACACEAAAANAELDERRVMATLS